jgi:menaquinone-9 beta-reductase
MRTLSCDVAVIGAGPSGSTAAAFLARDGIDALVLERCRFPREKVCGDGLTPRAIKVLAALGVEDELLRLGYRPFHKFRIVSSWGQSIVAGFPEMGVGGDHGYVVQRKVLDDLVARAAVAAGARLAEETEALGLARDADERAGAAVRARTAEGEDILVRARFVIAGDGSRGSFSRAVLGPRRMKPYGVAIRAYAEGLTEVNDWLHFFLDENLLPGGYGWIFPSSHPGEPVNLGVGLTTERLKGKPETLSQLLNAFLGSESLAARHTASGVRFVARPTTSPVLVGVRSGRRLIKGVLVVGDAAHLVDPLTGEGMACALESGQAAAAAVGLALCTGHTRELYRYPAHIFLRYAPEFVSSRILRQLLTSSRGAGMIAKMVRDHRGNGGRIERFRDAVPSCSALAARALAPALMPSRLLEMLRAADSVNGPRA